MSVLHAASFGHRDISTGNIMLVRGPDNSRRGVLVDFEYTVPLDFDPKQQGAAIFAGTSSFVATEVVGRCYMFWNHARSLKPQLRHHALHGTRGLPLLTLVLALIPFAFLP